MTALLAAKRAAAAGSVSRALALALRSPAVVAKLRAAPVPLTSKTRHGQHARPVPINRHGKPHQ